MFSVRYICLVALIATIHTHAQEWTSLEKGKPLPSASVTAPQSQAKQTLTQTTTTKTTAVPSKAPAAGNSGAVQLLYEQLNTMRQEVQSLRNIVEAQTHELRKLKAEQKERYIELDRRMSQILQVGAAPLVQEDKDVAVSDDSNEQAKYDEAFQLIKDKKLPEALIALQGFLTQYPQSPLAVNVHYWTGQIYYIQGELDEARKAFLIVVNQFPDHQKTADSKLKLGKVYHQLGEEAKAKETLQSVMADHAQTSPGTARLAENYLHQNF